MNKIGVVFIVCGNTYLNTTKTTREQRGIELVDNRRFWELVDPGVPVT